MRSPNAPALPRRKSPTSGSATPWPPGRCAPPPTPTSWTTWPAVTPPCGGSPAQAPSVAAPAEANTAELDPSSTFQFVAYAGDQTAGFEVASVPDGWKVQGVNEYVLLIAPPTGVDPSLDVFVGKIAVMLESQDASGPYEGEQIPVGDSTGVISRPGDGYGQLH